MTTPRPILSQLDRLLYRNTLANVVGFLAMTAISVITGPIVFRIVGPTEYGIIGIFQLMMTLAIVFDYGVSVVLSREVAARTNSSSQPSSSISLKSVLGSLELTLFLLAGVVAAALIGLSDWLAHHWFNAPASEASAVRLCIIIGATSLCVQRVRTLGMAVMSGRQQQIALNMWNVSMSAVRLVSGISVVFFYSSTAIAYLLTQLFLSLLEAWFFHVKAWHGITRKDNGPYFSGIYIESIWRSLLANWGAIAAATLVTSADKMIMSGNTDLRSYAQYSLIAFPFILLGGLVNMAQSAFFPRLVIARTSLDFSDLSSAFSLYSTIASALCIPLSVGIAVFGDRIISLLLGAAPPIPNLWLFLIALAGAGALNALTRVPHSLQIADGRPGIALRFNIVSAFTYIPACWIAGLFWGPVGICSAWLFFNFVYLPLFLRATEGLSGMPCSIYWIIRYVILPVAISLVFFITAKELDRFGLFISLGSFAITTGLATIGCLITSRDIRQLLLSLSNDAFGRR